MKKTLIIVAFATFIFTSCKKDYTCSCTTYRTVDYTSFGGTKNSSTSVMSTTITDTESNATTKCNDMDQAEQTVAVTTTSIDCIIK